MTQIQQTIVLVSIIGTILSEYDEKESTPAVRAMKFSCSRFMELQSGVKNLPFRGPKVVDKKKHLRFVQTIKIGDSIWQRSLDRYAKQKVTIDAVSLIKAVYDFAPELLAKHAHISQKKITDYLNESKDGDNDIKTKGAVVGGYLVEMLALEMGIKINGRLGALKNKVMNDLGMVA